MGLDILAISSPFFAENNVPYPKDDAVFWKRIFE